LSNWLLSFFEDGWVLVMLWLALQYPVLFAVTLLLTLLLSVCLLMLLWRFSRQLLLRLQQRFRPKATRDDALG
jgi:membrane protein implicated in regulation of membrane protease activity